MTSLCTVNVSNIWILLSLLKYHKPVNLKWSIAHIKFSILSHLCLCCNFCSVHHLIYLVSFLLAIFSFYSSMHSLSLKTSYCTSSHLLRKATINHKGWKIWSCKISKGAFNNSPNKHIPNGSILYWFLLLRTFTSDHNILKKKQHMNMKIGGVHHLLFFHSFIW